MIQVNILKCNWKQRYAFLTNYPLQFFFQIYKSKHQAETQVAAINSSQLDVEDSSQ